MSETASDSVRVHGVETLSANWYTLQKVTFGRTRKDGSRQTLAREIYHIGLGAAVLPLDRERGTVLLVRQFRLPAHINGDPALLVEACAGMVESGDDPAEAICKELEQEVGYRVRALKKVFEIYMNPGVATEVVHLFTAEYSRADHIGKGGGIRGEGEEIEVLELPLLQAWNMVATGQIVDAKTIVLLQHARLQALDSTERRSR